MSNNLGMEKQQLIKQLLALGWSARRIEREMGFSRKTVTKYKIQNAPEVPADFSAEKSQLLSISKVDSIPTTNSKHLYTHLEYIKERIQLNLTAQRVYQDLVEERGYLGSYDSVKRYFRKLKKKNPRHFERLPTYPGMEAQVDFASGPKIYDGAKHRCTWFFKMTLSFSGHSYEELVYGQDVETFLRCHENAFKSFGGVPKSIKLDNLKSGVLRANLYEPVLNSAYLAFSEYWGFAPNPCAPRHPEQKGRVERDVGYTKSNALRGRDFKTLEEGNLYLRHWNKKWARTRIHGTTKRQVWALFQEKEYSALLPLKENPFSYFKIGERKVDVHGHIEVKGSYYSVPHTLIGTYVNIHFNSKYIKVYKQGELITEHKNHTIKGKVTSLNEHRPSHKPVNQEQEESWHLIRAKSIGASCYKLIDKILLTDDIRAIHRVRGIMSLNKKYGALILEAACTLALQRYSYRYNTVKSFCEAIKQDEFLPEEDLLQEHELIRDLSEYQILIN
jgi:transposase